MNLTSNSISDGQSIAGDFAFCVRDPVHHVCLGKNLNPHLDWRDVPAGTKSFVVICCDPDVPSKGDDVNQEDRSVPASLPRVDFFHWVLIDLPATLNTIRQGEFSDDVTPRGKAGPLTLHGARQGVNDFTGWFAGDNDMRGDYYGYDGPCPPWNDEIRHHYVFTVYALDIERLSVDGTITGQKVREAMQSHILDQASITGTYTLNPSLTE
jgi:Raf kinase inhibitor-like YbhB/YbcL family protein